MAAVASWLPFVRATAIGWVPVAQNAIPPAHVQSDRLQSDEKVTEGMELQLLIHLWSRVLPDNII